HTTAYVLDSRKQPVPVGEIGELYLGGAGLARGYLNCPDLTRERFVCNPFGGELDSRLYRTGDLVRASSDGTLEFLGRIDDQVKIAGHRIEPREIEAVLHDHPQVRQAAVVAVTLDAGDKQLVAYVVPRQGNRAISELKKYLAERLPCYMIPAHIVTLDRLP